MTNPTSNFNWQMPTPTDLVTDLPADFEIFGQAVDTTLADLKGGTTGQLLSKNSNTDMDFTWTSSSGISATIVDAKGDLIAATAADTVSRLAVGTNGQLLTADSTAATGLAWTTVSAGGMTELATGSLSGTTTTISSISGSYKNLVIRLDSPDISSNGGVFMRFNGDTANNYRYASIYSDQYGVVQNSGATNSIQPITTMAADGVNAGATMTVYDYADNSQYKPIIYSSAYKFNAALRTEGGFGGYVSASAITSLSIIAESTSTLTGTYFIYGVN